MWDEVWGAVHVFLCMQLVVRQNQGENEKKKFHKAQCNAHMMHFRCNRYGGWASVIFFSMQQVWWVGCSGHGPDV